MTTWPTDLPPPAIGTLDESPPNNAIASQPDKGPAFVRRRTTSNIRPLAFSMMLTPDEVQILDDFFTIDTFSGTVTFNYNHPRTGDACTARFKPGSVPKYVEREGVIYGASVELEIMP